MTILPAPAPDEIAAILVAIQSATPAHAENEAKSKPSRWRMAGRDFTSGALR